MNLCVSLVINLIILAFSNADEDAWWKNTIVYQIYPRSFQDSDGDGIGDLKGIESRLNHFVDVGIETIWLSPIYKSPMKDFGYDISDFKDVDPTFGTIEDFKSLMAKAEDLQLNVIMDFVPNHSSDEHEWFNKSVNGEDPYTDYYVWADPKGLDENGLPIPPNNWVSIFGGSAWTYNEQRDQFYYHQFLAEQPDLNYRSEALLQEMLDILSFWLDLGVDGFRMDAVFHLVESIQLKDEPLSNNTNDPNDYGYLDHIYTTNQPETVETLGKFYDFLKSYALSDGHDRISMLEVYASSKDLQEYHEVSDFPFNFNFIGLNKDIQAKEVANSISDWMNNLPEEKTANWLLGNHDQWRIGSRTSPEIIDALNFLTLTLPGVAITYYGEEIGMLNGNISYENTVDPSGCKCGPDHYADQGCSRDPERTPMQWQNKTSAGFSRTNNTWLPVNPNFEVLNVEDQILDPTSHLRIYKSAIELRKSLPGLYAGNVEANAIENILMYTR